MESYDKSDLLETSCHSGTDFFSTNGVPVLHVVGLTGTTHVKRDLGILNAAINHLFLPL